MNFRKDKPSAIPMTMTVQSPAEIILASASPRRRELLAGLGLSFRIVPAEIEERPPSKTTPGKYVELLAIQKAGAVAKDHSNALVIGADTVVVLDKDILGKPSTSEEARAMLQRLSGKTHQVFTGVALIHNDSNRVDAGHAVTDVTFGGLDREKIERYVQTGEPMDKAGAYGIQGLGATLVKEIRGCYFNVVGLPLYMLAEMLADWGYQVP